MTSIDNLVSAYVRLLVWQYQLPRAQGMCAIIAKQLLMDCLPFSVREGYNPSPLLGPIAVGPQLDVVGKYVGLPRNIGAPAPLPWFGFLRSAGGGNPNGFNRVATGDNRSVVFYRTGYKGNSATQLSDTSFAFMLALQIILNSSDGTLASIQNYLAALLPGAVTVVDNKDMTLTYTITGVLPIDSVTLGAYLPKPMGVGINIKTNDFIVTDGGDFIVTDGGDKLITTP